MENFCIKNVSYQKVFFFVPFLSRKSKTNFSNKKIDLRDIFSAESMSSM